MKKDKNRKKKHDSIEINREATALFFALAAFLSAYVFIVADSCGIIGRAFLTVLLNVFGTTSYILPFIFLWYSIIYFRQSMKIRARIDFILSILCLISISVLFEFTRFVLKLNVSGGWIGSNLYPFFKEFFGVWFGFIIVAMICLMIIAKFLRVSLVYSICNFVKKLQKDIIDSNSAKIQGGIDTQQKKIDSVTQQDSVIEFSKQESIKPNIVNKQEEENKKENVVNQPIVKPEIEIMDSKSFDYKLPPIDLLVSDSASGSITNKNELFQRAELLKKTLADFGISVEVKDIIPGPVITRYDLILAPGIRIQTVSNVIDNISLAMRTASIRVVPIPEKAVVGIEVPNSSNVTVGLRGILESEFFKNSHSLLTLALGKTTDGLGYVTNLSSMPHLLIAGATGSGKSVGIHTIILSILYKARPDEVKFMLIDPKRVEMPIYKDIPHLYNPCVDAVDADIITNPREAVSALKKLVVVMEDRYKKFAKFVVRNIEDYNNKVSEVGGEKEFYIVVIIDELADLMLIVQKEIEDSIQRLAQMARAVGIHLILATQRPSVNVITGIIKANFPARLSFQTTSKVDSRVILDMVGAEFLIGKGDMLFLPPGESRPVRLQGAFVSLKEAEKIISFINKQNFPRVYEPMVIEVDSKDSLDANKEKLTKDLIPALKLISERKRVSQDLLKANFGSSARATNILSILEIEGFISKPDGVNKWQIDFDKISKYLEMIEK
ncbi:MAG: DNA translocase FtsK 4TM domain-containing protein [Endomicrobium sp.]|nr:DNA translocase FtsK 4TM domain-containing protein [Endomicrobium sp.]